MLEGIIEAANVKQSYQVVIFKNHFSHRVHYYIFIFDE